MQDVAMTSALATAREAGLSAFVRYFPYLGTMRFGGPVVLAGFIHRDFVEQRGCVSEEEG